jgi:hypothetical protein
LTTSLSVVTNSNVEAGLLFRKREALSETAFMEMVIWRVPGPVRGSAQDFKYSLALVSEDVGMLRYDNEGGKGDHKHVGGRETPHRFTDLTTLHAAFWKDVATGRRRQREP